MTFTLESQFFQNGGWVPLKYTAQGEDVSPPLSWVGVPEKTRELALLVEDPDAPTPKPFVHWIAYGIDPNAGGLREEIDNADEISVPLQLKQGRNSMLRIGYTGPNPPFFHKAHRYFFRLFALDQKLELRPGVGREEFLEALEGHVIAKAELMGRYEKPRRAKAWGGAKALAVAGIPLVVFSLWRSRRSGYRKEHDEHHLHFTEIQ